MEFGHSFEDILAAAQEGANWAWDRVYRALAPQVHGYLRAKGAKEPEDLVGEVFLQLARNIGGFDGDEQAFRAWVFTVTHHRLIDSWRKAGRDKSLAVGDQVHEQVAGNAEDDAMAHVSRGTAIAMLDGLSEDQRTVMLLRIVADMSLEQVAEAMGKRVGAVKALQHRAVASLRKKLEVPVTQDGSIAVTQSK